MFVCPKISKLQLVVDQASYLWKHFRKQLMANFSSELLRLVFEKCLPAWETLSDASYRFILRMTCDLAKNSTASGIAPASFGSIYGTLKTMTASSDVSLASAECYLYIMHQIAAKNHSLMRDVCGVFVASCQPSDFRPEILAKKAEFEGAMAILRKCANEEKTQLVSHSVRV